MTDKESDSDSVKVVGDTEDDWVEVNFQMKRKSNLTAEDIKHFIVKCTACGDQINHLDDKKLKKHIHLDVLMCKDCIQFYGSGEFSQDDDGDKYCRWCGNGGKLYGCDYCKNSFCNECIRRNFGRGEVTKISKKQWKCYKCNPVKLKHKVNFCDFIISYSKGLNKKRAKKSITNQVSTEDNSLSKDLIISAFDCADEACTKFCSKLNKLRSIQKSQSKSYKMVIRKIDAVVHDHNSELKKIVKKLYNEYNKFIKKSQKPAENDAPITNGYCKSDTEDEKRSTQNSDATDSQSVLDSVIDTVCNEMQSEKLKLEESVNFAKKSLLENSSDSSCTEDIKAKDAAVTIPHDESKPELEETKEETVCEQNLTPGVKLDSDEISSQTNEIDLTKPILKKVEEKSDEGSASSICLSSSDDQTSKEVHKEPVRKASRKKNAKLASQPKIDIKELDGKVSCEEKEKSAETAELELEATIRNLEKEPIIKISTYKEVSKTEAKGKAPKKKGEDSSSSPIVFTSSDEEEGDIKKLSFLKTNENDDIALEKKGVILISSSSSSDVSDHEEEEEEEVKKRKTKSKKKDDSSSSSDFVSSKKRKHDKLLDQPIELKEKKSTDKEKSKKKQKKRKILSSDESHKSKSSESDDSSSDSVKREKPSRKGKKRRRIQQMSGSSSEGDKDKVPNSQESSAGKGRKNIRKVISGKKLADETKEAQIEEKERRRRVQERQKLYNKIVEKTQDGKEDITRKMVLEVDPVSKEEIVEIHPEIVEKLKPHQVNGVKFMWECNIESLAELEKKPGSGCILAHCMGLGKTLQVIAFLHTCLTNPRVNQRIKTAMVICPYNTVLNWSNEFDRWLGDIDAPSVLVHELAPARTNRMRLDILQYWQAEGGVLIISYDIFRRLVVGQTKLSKKVKESLMRCLLDPGADIVVCDEGHILKNQNSAISQATSRVKTQRRVVLTGTPLQNNLKEYHCMMHFVKPNLLGKSNEFTNRFVNPIINGQYDDSSERDVKLMKKRVHILHKLLEGCVQRCDYSALTKLLLPKHEFVISVKMSELQIRMYRFYLDHVSQSQQSGKLEGRKLFTDYNNLMHIWTYPYIVQNSHTRRENRRARKETDDEDSFIDDASQSSPATSSGAEEKANESSEEELVRKYVTRSRKNEEPEDDEPEVVEEPEKQWFHEFISEEDRYKLETSGKILLLLDILKECEMIGDKVIVFSNSLLTLDMVEDILGYVDNQPLSEVDKTQDTIGSWAKGLDYFRMDGATSADMRKRWIDLFNNPKNERARLFLISTKAGSLGTNLVGANRVVLLDASWNPSHDVQAIFRVYRFGQTKPVYIYRLLAQGTMEEKIYDRQVTKLSLSFRVVDEQQIERHFSSAQLAELYTFEPDSTSNRPTPMVPKDRLLAEMLIRLKDWIVNYHEHDSLLQNQTEEDLTEEERQAAWTEYENEKEGLNTDNIDPSLNAEPDFTQADYDGQKIPDANEAVKMIMEKLKSTYPLGDTLFLRQKLIESLNNLRSIYQMKQLRVLRIKQEYVARGSVPQSVNKYLDELGRSLTAITNYITEFHKLIMQEEQQRQLKQAQLKHAQMNAQQYMQGMRGMRIPPNVVFQRMPRFQFNPQMNNYYRMNYHRPPVVTEATEEPESSSSRPNSSVIITEIE